MHLTTPSVIIVLGQTASGKSRFAIELAKQLNSVIVCADAFQVYRDFSVGTDKVSKEEMDGVKHYGLDLVDPGSEFTVKDFLNYAVPLIKSELQNGRSPIVVGGTHMYIEKLIFTSRLDEEVECATPDTKRVRPSSGVSLHEELRLVDPVMASRLHPNDIRRISRAIDFYCESGGSQLLSAKLSSQDRALRFSNTFVFCKTAAVSLEMNIRARIELKMVRNNQLLCELVRIQALVDAGTLHWNKGLLQAIGYREFDPSLSSSFESGIEAVITHTIQYSKKQKKWIKKIDKSIRIHEFSEFDFGGITEILNSAEPQLRALPQWNRL